MQVLRRLRSAPSLERRVGALASHLNVAPPTVSDAVGTLAAKGLVRRVPVPRTRAVRLDPTAAGRRRADELAVTPPLIDTLQRLAAPDKAATLSVCLEIIAPLQRRGGRRRP